MDEIDFCKESFTCYLCKEKLDKKYSDFITQNGFNKYLLLFPFLIIIAIKITGSVKDSKKEIVMEWKYFYSDSFRKSSATEDVESHGRFRVPSYYKKRFRGKGSGWKANRTWKACANAEELVGSKKKNRLSGGTS